jgi:hypothetical protein
VAVHDIVEGCRYGVQVEKRLRRKVACDLEQNVDMRNKAGEEIELFDMWRW